LNSAKSAHGYTEKGPSQAVTKDRAKEEISAESLQEGRVPILPVSQVLKARFILNRDRLSKRGHHELFVNDISRRMRREASRLLTHKRSTHHFREIQDRPCRLLLPGSLAKPPV
ncbi:hypothetical protein cypCar_00044919, partial [Cyprinus carpio]